MKHIKNIISLGLVMLAGSCVGVLVSNNQLTNYQLLFVVSTMNVAACLVLVINKVQREN